MEPHVGPPLDYVPQRRALSGGGWLRLTVDASGSVSPRLPAICCNCLSTTAGSWEPPVITPFAYRIPICPACRRYWEGRYRRRLLGCLAVTQVAQLGAIAVGRAWPYEAWLYVLTCALVGLIASKLVAQQTALPLRQTFQDRFARTLSVRFRNRAFLDVLEQDLGVRDGPPAWARRPPPPPPPPSGGCQ